MALFFEFTRISEFRLLRLCHEAVISVKRNFSIFFALSMAILKFRWLVSGNRWLYRLVFLCLHNIVGGFLMSNLKLPESPKARIGLAVGAVVLVAGGLWLSFSGGAPEEGEVTAPAASVKKSAAAPAATPAPTATPIATPAANVAPPAAAPAGSAAPGTQTTTTVNVTPAPGAAPPAQATANVPVTGAPAVAPAPAPAPATVTTTTTVAPAPVVPVQPGAPVASPAGNPASANGTQTPTQPQTAPAPASSGGMFNPYKEAAPVITDKAE